MGFTPKRKTILIAFADEELAGLEVRARSTSVAGLIDVMGLLDLADAKGLSAEELAKVKMLFKVFAGCPAGCSDVHEELQGQDGSGQHHANKIESWNIEDEHGQAVSADYAGLMAQEFDLALTLVLGWLEGVVGTPGPLGSSSNAGTPSAAPPMPMETLPADLLS